MSVRAGPSRTCFKTNAFQCREVVLAALVIAARTTHVPSRLISGQEGPMKAPGPRRSDHAGSWAAGHANPERYIPGVRHALAVELRLRPQCQRAPPGRPDEPRGAAHDSEHELRLCRPSAAAGSAGRAALGAGLKPEWLDEHLSRGRAEGCLLLRARRARPSSESANGGSFSARRGRGASTW